MLSIGTNLQMKRFSFFLMVALFLFLFSTHGAVTAQSYIEINLSDGIIDPAWQTVTPFVLADSSDDDVEVTAAYFAIDAAAPNWLYIRVDGYDDSPTA